MPISFNSIPANWRMPLVWMEVDPSKAGLPINILASLLVGVQLTAPASKATVNVPLPIASQAQADAAFGQGSQLARMFKAYFANNWAGQVWGLPVAEGTTAATGTITITGTATAAGSIDLYIGGTNVPVPVANGDTPTIIGPAAAAAINANKDLPVTATALAGVVTVTCKGKGVYGNDIKMQDSYYGAIGGELVPAGLTLAYVNLAGGAGVPSFAAAISGLGEAEVEYVCMPYTDSNSMLSWETEFGFSDTGRWGFVRQHYGHLFSSMRDTYANLLAFAATRNSAQMSVLGVELLSPTPVWEWAAAYTAKAARGLSNDPARPLQTLTLEGCLPPPLQGRFLLSELNSLSLSGIATQRSILGMTPTIARETTTYTKNLYGNSDDAYEVVTTLATLAKIMRDLRQAITSKFPRSKLADDGTRFGAGQAIVTPKSIKAELIAQYRIEEFQGIVENAKAFKDNLIVERDVNDPNRVNVLLPPDLVNQLRVFAVLVQFRLQFDRGLDLAIAA